FLAMDHDAEFIAASALNSLAINAVNAIFALVYALMAQKRSLLVSQALAMVVWFVLAWIVHSLAWTATSGFLFNVVVLLTCTYIARPLRHVAIPRITVRWHHLAMRAAMVATLVGVVVTLSFRIGPGGSGILAVFPIILLSVQIILHRQVGGKPTAAVMANAVLGLTGFAFACLVLHFTAVPFGSAIGLSLALATSIGWSLLVLFARRRGIAV